jgi:hypothetical protein
MMMFQQDEQQIMDDEKFEAFKNQIRLQQMQQTDTGIFNNSLGGVVAQSRDPNSLTQKKKPARAGGPISITSGNVNMIDMHFQKQQLQIESKTMVKPKGATSPKP